MTKSFSTIQLIPRADKWGSCFGLIPKEQAIMMNSMQPDNLSIEDLLPHRGRMLLVEEILEIDHTHAVTAAVANKSWPLAANTGIGLLILIELAAQTAGICNSRQGIITEGKGWQNKGWLVGLKQADFLIPAIPLHSRIITRSENTFGYEQLREISSSHWIDEILIGNVTLQLMQA